MNERPNWMWMILIPVLLLSACGGQPHASARAGPLPRGVMPAARACRLVVDKARPGFFIGTEHRIVKQPPITAAAVTSVMPRSGSVTLGRERPPA
jgi:hypothetical protein